MDIYQKYCTGCGLCQSIGESELNRDERGFLHPIKNSDLLKKVCPVSGVQANALDKNNIWGRSEGVYLGWSNNSFIRNKASSGGILTEIACYLLNSKKVHAIIHVGAGVESPTETSVFISETSDEVITHCGSRYCISSPLSVIGKLDFRKKYAFIGKPCDVVTLRNYLEISPEYKESIPYMLSFFCMGLPSAVAQQKLLQRLECSDCKSLNYRGNGWPGFANATDAQGQVHQITYDESWGKILGRDLMPACRFCIDGIGELADISCGDAWYLTENKKPDFTEHEGRNVVFARTEKGNKLLSEMTKQKIVTLNQYTNYKEELPFIQTSQWNRRREMSVRILTMKILGQKPPSYDSQLLGSYAKGLSVKQCFRVIAGTGKRILKGKM